MGDTFWNYANSGKQNQSKPKCAVVSFFSLLPSCWFVHYLLAFSYFRSQQLSLTLAVFFQVFIHPKSVNFQANNFDSPYLVYHEKVKTSKVQYSFNPQFISSLGLLPVILQKNYSKLFVFDASWGNICIVFAVNRTWLLTAVCFSGTGIFYRSPLYWYKTKIVSTPKA